jgi:hypothetical protein
VVDNAAKESVAGDTADMKTGRQPANDAVPV